MVECDRLGGPKSAPAKMTRVACVKRYRIANEGMDGDKEIKASPCRECPVGCGRSAGYTIPEFEGPGAFNGARVINRTCTKCGAGFRGYPASKFCAACKKARPKVGRAKSRPVAAPEKPQAATKSDPAPMPQPAVEEPGGVYQRDQVAVGRDVVYLLMMGERPFVSGYARE